MAAPFKMQERDLDLFILEEFHANSGFAEWFAEQIGIEEAKFLGAEHSVSAKVNAKWGETDVLAYFNQGEDIIAVLIEDKISAAFTENQCQRYHERGKDIIALGKATKYRTILIAPKSYIDGVPTTEEWCVRLSLQQIKEWFAGREGAHSAWRAAAIHECLRNVNRMLFATDPERNAFLEEFSDYLKNNYIGFSHDPTGDRYGISIKFGNRPNGFSIFWKLNKNIVDLQIMNGLRGRIKDAEKLVGIIDHSTESTGMLGIPVSSASWDRPLSEQMDVVSEVVAACQRLRSLALEIAATP
ncbi:PD-(D/E)XK nuclease family protein [Azorhizobium caulinodans]|uniref:PD-(D/E)XK nuclease family protein n=1 Tax=Azorhizobium caulinodans TaxID=7 RepID=UPI002FBE347A